MKNKKLFAILTLVCFMFTLMPVAAFAADEYVEAQKAGSAWDDSVTVEIDDAVALQVNGGAGTEYFFAVDEDGELDQVTTTGAIAFDEVGTYKVYAVSAAEGSAINGQVISKAAKLELLMEADSLVDDYAVVKVKAGDVEYRISLDATEATTTVVTDTAYEEYSVGIYASEGWEEDGLITATLEKSTDNGATWEDVKGAELDFNVAGYVDVALENGAKTDRGGDVEFEVTSDRAGEYTMYVKYGNDAKVKLNVTVVTSVVSDVEAVAVPTAPVNIDQNAQAADIEFKFFDAKGAAYTGPIAGDYKITVVSQPADSDMEGTDFGLVKEEKANGDSEDDAKGVYTLTGMFEEEGEYTIKVSLENGASATATVKVAEQGDITAIKFDVYNTPRTVAYGATTQVNKVIGVDANGVTSNLTVADGVEFSASGLAINTFTATGVLNAKNDDKFIGSTITVMAVYDELVATTQLTVVDVAATINYGEMTAEVGLNSEFVGSVVDADGKNSSIAAYSPTAKAIVLSKPANAVAVVDADMNSKGQVVLSFLASEAGEYEVQTIVTYSGNTYVTSIDTITVGGVAGEFNDVVVISIGADKMIVNSEAVALDVAPYIEAGRTMLQFNVLYAFGVDVEWVAETQSIVAEGNGIKVVMTLGEKVATVNGAEVALDVAPQIVNGRTVVPVGFITGTFGIAPTFTYNADGTIADILFTK